MRFLARWKSPFSTLAFLGSWFVLSAAEPVKVEMSVQLPPFIVETTKGIPWRYGRIPEFEILSRCEEGTTDRLVLAYLRASRLLGTVLPPRYQLALDVPPTLIFYDEKSWSAVEKDAAAALFRSRTILSSDPLPGVPAAPAGSRGFFDNLMLSDADVIATFTVVSSRTVDLQETYLTPEYVKSLLVSRQPALPKWLIAGFLRVYARMKFQDDMVRLEYKRWQFGERPALASRNATAEEMMPSLADFFSEQSLRAGRDPWIWIDQAELFVAWGINPAEPGRVTAFWRFVELASTGPPTEEGFQACFGFGYAEAARQMVAYAASSRRTEWPFPRENARLPGFRTCVATEGEIARIKGDWERLEVRYVRKHAPDLESTYVDLARRTLRKAYDHDDRDPRLLAVLGLLEVDAGNKTAAREFLEAAVAQAVVRPRAYYELARLRYDVLFGRSTRDDGKLTPEQANSILEPLLAGSRQAPPLAAVYELMSHVAFHSTEPPSAEILAALAEGERLFPGRNFASDGN